MKQGTNAKLSKLSITTWDWTPKLENNPHAKDDFNDKFCLTNDQWLSFRESITNGAIIYESKIEKLDKTIQFDTLNKFMLLKIDDLFHK